MVLTMKTQTLSQKNDMLLTVNQMVFIHTKMKCLWHFKRDEIEENVDLTVDDNHIPNNSSSFKYKSSFITNRNGVKTVVSLKHLSNFWRSLEMSLIILNLSFY